MTRWDDLHRAIEARDNESTEQIWMELFDADLEQVDRFLDAARVLVTKSGGKRQGGILLWMLAEALKEKDRPKDLIGVYVQLAHMAPDDGTVRQGLLDAARAAFPGRADLDSLLEKSGVLGGPPETLADQADTLASYLRLEPGAYVFHKSGWGTGRIVDYLADRSRCVIDFKDRPGHEMDIDAAAGRLERLAEDDLRTLALADPKRLRKWATEEPLEMIRQVLGRFGGSTSLRHVKDALVPDAIPTSRWSTWWKGARKAAHLDPRFHVSGGRDPRLDYHGTAQVNFETQVERTFKGCATVEDRQKAAREFLNTVSEDDTARGTLRTIIHEQIKKATKPATRLGWDLVLAVLESESPDDVMRDTLLASEDPHKLLATISDHETRSAAGRALTSAREDGAQIVYDTALAQDDSVLAEVGVDRFAVTDHAQLMEALLDQVDAKPAIYPSLWGWYVRGLRRKRWDGRVYDPLPLMKRLLKVLDAVEYRSRRTGTLKDKRGVTALCDVLASRQGQLVKEAAEAADRPTARHLINVVEQNRGIKGRAQQKIQTQILRVHPDALRTEAAVVVAEGEPVLGERLDRIYMTPEGIERVKAQVTKIEGDEMSENRKEIARAREFGDLSENAEYHAAREKQGMLQAKVDQLSSDLARALPITKDIVRTDAVSVGARVRLKDSDGHEYTYVLLGPPDADVANGIINYLTPLGQALMGAKASDTVQVVVEDEKRDLEILAIENSFD